MISVEGYYYMIWINDHIADIFLDKNGSIQQYDTHVQVGAKYMLLGITVLLYYSTHHDTCKYFYKVNTVQLLFNAIKKKTFIPTQILV